MGEFPHQKLRVYGDAVRFAADVYAATASLPHRCRPMSDQLFRAATSIALNIAEGAAEWRPAEQARFYRMSRRSAAESAAAADILLRIGVANDPRLMDLSVRAASMAARLTRLIHYVETRRSSGRRSRKPDSRLQTPDSRP